MMASTQNNYPDFLNETSCGDEMETEKNESLYYLDNIINSSEVERVVGTDGVEYAVLSKDIEGKTFAASWVKTDVLRGGDESEACSFKE